jgi:hypothetical protein
MSVKTELLCFIAMPEVSSLELTARVKESGPTGGYFDRYDVIPW